MRSLRIKAFVVQYQVQQSNLKIKFKKVVDTCKFWD